MRYIWAYIVPATATLGIYLGDTYVFLGIAYIFLIHPILDKTLSQWSKKTEEHILASEILLHATLPTQLFFIFFSLYIFEQRWENLSTLETAGFILSLGGATGAFGITAAHELIHRKNIWSYYCGAALLTTVLYVHFTIEHVLGHHKEVATPDDPATSRKNEWVYTFYFKSIIGGLLSSIRIAFQRNLISRIAAFFGVQFVLIALISFIFPHATSVFLLQGLVAILLLETINYVEHYGLERKKRTDGTYEPVREEHSWDTYTLLTNASLFDLGFHAHHHAQASVPFQKLKKSHEAPEMPLGYSTMFLLALIPPLWFAVMNKKLENRQSFIKAS